MSSSPPDLVADRKHHTAIYDRRMMPLGYDMLISTVFAPFGGVRRLRCQTIDRLDLRPGMRVLELGCGTGGITRLLLARGVEVTAVDGSQRMLARARRRAPAATYVHSRLESFNTSEKFDRVLFAFVLHEFAAADCEQVMAAALDTLRPEGLLAILDHAVPQKRGLAKARRRFLMRLEPPTVVHCIENGYDRQLAALGVSIVSRHELAGGTAQLILGRRAVSSPALKH
jgi:ubiquinone/menaquinone biosynthesis C-methylase UbiE